MLPYVLRHVGRIFRATFFHAYLSHILHPLYMRSNPARSHLIILKSLHRFENFDHSLHLIWAVSFKNFLKYK